jgi:hypothetical protein
VRLPFRRRRENCIYFFKCMVLIKTDRFNQEKTEFSLQNTLEHFKFFSWFLAALEMLKIMADNGYDTQNSEKFYLFLFLKNISNKRKAVGVKLVEIISLLQKKEASKKTLLFLSAFVIIKKRIKITLFCILGRRCLRGPSSGYYQTGICAGRSCSGGNLTDLRV